MENETQMKVYLPQVLADPTSDIQRLDELNPDKAIFQERSMKKKMRRMKKKTYLVHLDALFEHHELLSDPSLNEFGINKLDDLNSLRAILMEPHSLQALAQDGKLKQSESFAMEVGLIISKFDLKKMDINMARRLLDAILRIWKPGGLWLISRTDIFTKWPKPSRKYYPRTGQHRFVDHIVEYLEQVMVKAKDDDSMGPLKLWIFRLQLMLQLVSGRLVEISERHKEDVVLKNLMEEVAYLAYETEYAIDSYLVREIPVWYSMFWLQDIQERLEIKTRQLNSEPGDIHTIITKIIGCPTSSSMKLKTIAILNNNIDGENLDEICKAIAHGFDICTWSLVSSYKERKREVFLQLLRNASSNPPYIGEGRDEIEHISDLSEKKLKKLVQVLLGEKDSLIILKDVDDIEDLDDIKRVLSHENRVFRFRSSSTILLTTHSPELVAQCNVNSEVELFIANFNEALTSRSQIKETTMEGDVVGFKAETERMLEQLTGGSKQLHIISIAGMAGQGKTTLAKKLYDDLSIVRYFDTRAWCRVSQVYDKKELLLELLGHVVELSDTVRQKNDEELAGMLCKSLRGRRFLVVLDDMRSTGAWNDLWRCFPNDKNGSRIIFTTRLQKLAFEAQRGSLLQPLDRLSNDESWTLLQNKLFQKETESCPLELLRVGIKIAKHCKGLPLSVVLTAGLLKRMEKKQDVWKQVETSLNSHILNDAIAKDKGVIELSYKHLPDPLKPCFLYFGAFLEDREVPVQKLIRLWIAEGFIKHSDSKSLEDVAEDYLLDLIGRSLVNVAQEKSIGGVKSCRVHDLLREFALIKATEENFFHQIQGNDEQLDSYSEPITFYRRWLRIFSKINPFFNLRAERKSSHSSVYYQRRLCIYSERNNFFKLKPFYPLVRSLLFFGASDLSPSYSYDILFIFRNFKLLRILNFEDINIVNSFQEIDLLLHLRYLAVQCTMVSIPSSIANLLNLETFRVKSVKNEAVEVPDSIWNMEKLRHVHINDRASFHMDPDVHENSFVLDNLQTLSTPSLAYGDGMEKILRKLRGIRKLRCIFLGSWNDATNSNQFPLLEFLDKLKSLKVFYNGEKQYPCEFNFPSNLKKLTLTNFRMPWSEISQLASLLNLEVLKLLGNAFEGERWEMDDEVVFSKLRFLKLDSLNVVEWIATDDHFPLLERLLLHKCEKLKKIPLEIGDITTLLIIEVKWCSPSAAVSAINIQQQQLEFGNEELKINVHPKIWDSEPS